MGAFREERVQLCHKSEFGLGASFPAEVELGHEVAELFAIEDHALEGEAIALAQGAGGGEDIGCEDLVQQARKFAIGEADAVEGLELRAEVLLKCRAVRDVAAVFVFEALKFADETGLDAVFPDDGKGGVGRLAVGKL